MAGIVQFLGFAPLPDREAQKLVNHRKALGLTQKQFAAQIEVDPSTLGRSEHGERESAASLAAIIKHIGVSFRQT